MRGEGTAFQFVVPRTSDALVQAGGKKQQEKVEVEVERLRHEQRLHAVEGRSLAAAPSPPDISRKYPSKQPKMQSQ